MPENEARQTQRNLMDAALRLVGDHEEVPAGSVLRCFARSVMLARRTGTPARDLAERAEAVARRLLAGRDRPELARRLGVAQQLAGTSSVTVPA